MQLLAAIANDADHMPALLHDLGASMEPVAVGEAGDLWGVGYYADDRALLIRKPGELLTTRTFHDLAANVRSQVVVAFVNAAGPGTTESSPHRFRRWLFGSAGDLSGLAPIRDRIRERLPSFIRSDLGNANPCELVFGMFLRDQHERGLLNDPLASGRALAESMERTTRLLTMLMSEAGIAPASVAFAATNGRIIIVSRRGLPIFHKTMRGLERLPDGPPDPARTDFQAVVQSLKRFRAVVFTSGAPEKTPGWTEGPEGGTVWVDRQLEVEETPA